MIDQLLALCLMFEFNHGVDRVVVALDFVLDVYQAIRQRSIEKKTDVTLGIGTTVALMTLLPF